MKSSTVTNSDRLTASIAVKMVQGAFWDVRLTVDGKHDRQTPIGTARLDKTLHNKVHVRICLGPESKSKENVNGEAGVAHP